MNFQSRRCFLSVTTLAAVPIMAGAADLALEPWLGAGEQFLRDHLSPQALESLQRQLDNRQAELLLQQLQHQFQGEYVLDLARVRKTAKTLLPLLEANPQTRGYAAWLRPRMDYLDVADQFQFEITPPRSPLNQQPAPPPNPTPEQERTQWMIQVARSPVSSETGDWIRRLKPIFASERVAPELVWIAQVESSFNPEAVSPSGATGLYQLMPVTAQSMGLRLRPQDERKNAEKNARAAAAYLRYLYQKFKDWPLTLAAFNAGEGVVRDILKSSRRKSFDPIAHKLPAETQMYVPRVEAVLKKQEKKILAQLPAPR